MYQKSTTDRIGNCPKELFNQPLGEGTVLSLLGDDTGVAVPAARRSREQAKCYRRDQVSIFVHVML